MEYIWDQLIKVKSKMFLPAVILYSLHKCVYDMRWKYFHGLLDKEKGWVLCMILVKEKMVEIHQQIKLNLINSSFMALALLGNLGVKLR